MPQPHACLNFSSLERIVPDQIAADDIPGLQTLQLHVERYEFAKENLVPGSLLDLACGAGYGTAALSLDPRVTLALGVDISDAVIKYAQARYAGDRLSYVCSDALSFSGDHLFANVVSLETIEHFEDPVELFSHLTSLTAPGGRLIASVPITPSVDANPHHQANFSRKRFLRMAQQFPLNYVASFEQVQPFNPFAVLVGREVRSVKLRSNLATFYLQNPSHLWLRFWSTLRHGFVNRYLTIVWEKKWRNPDAISRP